MWAEEVGPITMGHAEWSFGDRGSGASHRKSGYCIPVSGQIIRMSLTSVTQTGEGSDSATVSLIVNGLRKPDYGVTKETGKISAYTIFESPCEVQAGDVINFYSKTALSNARNSVVAVLIEIDL